MSLDAYKIGIQIALVDNVSRGLMAMAVKFEAVNKGAEQLESRLQKIQKAGNALVKAGEKIAQMWKEPLNAVRQYQTELERINRIQPGSAAAADKFIKSLDIKGQSYTDVAKLYGGALSVTQNSAQAEVFTKQLAQMKSGLMAATGAKDGAQIEEVVLTALKAARMRDGVINPKTGAINQEKAQETIDTMLKTYLVSKGSVAPKDYLEAMQSGKLSSAFSQSEATLFGLKQFMQANGGSQAGIAAVSTFQNWAAGKMSASVAHELERAKLLDRKAVHYDKSGRLVSVDTTGMARSQEFAQNPLKYLADVIVPALQKQGYAGERLNAKLESITGAKGRDLLQVLAHEQLRAGQYLQNVGAASGAGKLYEDGNKGLDGKLLDYESKMANLKITLGEHILPLAIAGLEKLNDLLGGVTKLAQEFPGVTKAIAYVVTGLAFLKHATGGLPIPGAGGLGKGMLRGALNVGKTLGKGALHMGGSLGRAGMSVLRAGAGLGRGALSAAGALARSPLAARALGALGPAGMVAGAAYGGWQLGSFINDKIISPVAELASGVKGASLGTVLFDLLHRDAGKQLVAPTPVPRPNAGQSASPVAGSPVKIVDQKLVFLKGDVTMDGRQVGQVVWKQISGNLTRPQTGSSNFNTGMQLMPSGL